MGFRYCSFCGSPRPVTEPRCSECGDASYTNAVGISHRAWLRRNNKIKTTNLIITGTKEFDDVKFIWDKLNKITANLEDVLAITGGYKDIDKIIADWAWKNKFLYGEYYPPGYHERESVKGMPMYRVRNDELLERPKVKAVIVFWDEEEPYTLDLIVKAKKKGILTRVIKVEV